MEIYSRYSPPPTVHLGEFEPTITQQHLREEVDINEIIDRAVRGAGLPGYDGPAPVFGDFSGIGDYRSCLDRVMEAESSFAGLPAKVRARFDNDPGLLVAFLGDPKNREEAVSLGFIQAGVPGVVPVVPPAPAAAGVPSVGAVAAQNSSVT